MSDLIPGCFGGFDGGNQMGACGKHDAAGEGGNCLSATQMARIVHGELNALMFVWPLAQSPAEGTGSVAQAKLTKGEFAFVEELLVGGGDLGLGVVRELDAFDHAPLAGAVHPDG